jgi:hypothetical protein
MLTIVQFIAFDKAAVEVFFNNESFEQIHSRLNRICNAYVPTGFILVRQHASSTESLEALKAIQERSFNPLNQ